MIRYIKLEDKEAYLEMVDEFYHSPAVLEPVPTGNYQKGFDEMMKTDAYVTGFIFQIEDKYAGYALLTKDYSTETGGFVYWIDEIYVRPAFQNHGIGNDFFKMLDDNPKYENFRLEVEKDNERAIALYKRLGFSELPYIQMIKSKNGISFS